MPPDLPSGAARAHALLAGWLGGLAVAHGVATAEAALQEVRTLADELLVPVPSLDGLARRGPVVGDASLPVLLPPLALLTFDSPANLLSVSWHVARLTHRQDEACWAAVAVNVALARFLQGHRDFVPDVIEALRNNDAPPPLLALARRLPLLSRRDLLALPGSQAPAVVHAVAALWLAEREPIAPRGVTWLDEAGLTTALPAAAALAGARDGTSARLPLALPVPDTDIRALAVRLARLTPS